MIITDSINNNRLINNSRLNNVERLFVSIF